MKFGLIWPFMTPPFLNLVNIDFNALLLGLRKEFQHEISWKNQSDTIFRISNFDILCAEIIFYLNKKLKLKLKLKLHDKHKIKQI